MFKAIFLSITVFKSSNLSNNLVFLCYKHSVLLSKTALKRLDVQLIFILKNKTLL